MHAYVLCPCCRCAAAFCMSLVLMVSVPNDTMAIPAIITLQQSRKQTDALLWAYPETCTGERVRKHKPVPLHLKVSSPILRVPLGFKQDHI